MGKRRGSAASNPAKEPKPPKELKAPPSATQLTAPVVNTGAGGWYAKEAFGTQYHGQILEFKADQLIDEPSVGQWLHDTGAPVEQREG